MSTPEGWCKRLTAMGVDARVMRGGRATIASLPLSDEPFAGLDRTLTLKRAMFSTVGAFHIKCLKPESLFALPLIDVRTCSSAADLEARIRAAWRERVQELSPYWDELQELGANCSARNPDSVVRIQLDGEAAATSARTLRRGEIILPSRGPLEGIALESREARVLQQREAPATASELQISIGNALDSLAETARRAEASARSERAVMGHAEATTIGVRNHCVLLVGPNLSRDTRVADSLKLRGYSVVAARSSNEAMRFYHRCSPELVITDADLGRAEGLELIPMLRALAGVENIPVIVVDEHRSPGRRAAAREVGAVGYIGGPLKIASIADRLAAMLDEPKTRRFTRYAQPIAIRIDGAHTSTTATALSRGGLYIATDENLVANTLQRCELVLAETGHRVEVEAEVLYRLGAGGRESRGVGLRFDRFNAGGEAEYLDFLRNLAA